MLVMDALAQMLKREGIEKLFCFPTTPIIEAAVAAGITPVICRQDRASPSTTAGSQIIHTLRVQYIRSLSFPSVTVSELAARPPGRQ